MMRALLFGTVSLVAVECFSMVDAPNAYANPAPACTSVGTLPNGGVPIGDFFIAQNGSAQSGTLDGSLSTLDYPQCSTDSLNTIPFDAAAAGKQKITVVAADDITGGYFDLIIDPGTGNSQTFSQTPSTASQVIAFGVTAILTAGLNTLAITEFNKNSSFAGPTADRVSVTITNTNFIPEPATLSLLGFGAICSAGLRRRRRTQDRPPIALPLLPSATPRLTT